MHHRVESAPEQVKLRVCHLAYSFYEMDNRVLRYVREILDQGGEVDIISLRRHGQPWRGSVDGANVYRIQHRRNKESHASVYLLKIGWFWVMSTVLLSLLQLRRRYHLIHVHNVPDFLVFAAWLPKILGVPIILDIHDIQPELYAVKYSGTKSALPRLMLWMERSTCRFADHVIVANHIWHERLIERAVDHKKCTPIMNYPDLRLFKPNDTSQGQCRPFVFLYPGSLSHHQGLDLAVQAFARAKDQLGDAEFHIYGEGPALPQLRRLVSTYQLDERVKLLAPLPIGDIAGVIASSNVGVEPKRAEGFSNEAMSTKILEFMACGVPVLVSRTRAHEYYFTETVVRFFKAGDANDLARQMRSLYQRHGDPDLVSAARDFARGYSWQARADDYCQLVESLVDVDKQSAIQRKTERQRS